MFSSLVYFKYGILHFYDLTSLKPCPVSRTAGGNHRSLILRRIRKQTPNTQNRFRDVLQCASCTIGYVQRGK